MDFENKQLFNEKIIRDNEMKRERQAQFSNPSSTYKTQPVSQVADHISKAIVPYDNNNRNNNNNNNNRNNRFDPRQGISEEADIIEELKKKNLVDLNIVDKKSGKVDLKNLKLYIRNRRLDEKKVEDEINRVGQKDGALSIVLKKARESDGFLQFLDSTFVFEGKKAGEERKHIEKLYIALMVADKDEKEKNIKHFIDVLNFLNIRTTFITRTIISKFYRLITEKIIFLLIASCYNATFVLERLERLITDDSSTVKKFLKVLFYICNLASLGKGMNNNQKDNENIRMTSNLRSWATENRPRQPTQKADTYDTAKPEFEDLGLGTFKI